MNSNNFSSHNRFQNIYNKKRFSRKNYKKPRKAIASIIYKENQNYNTTLPSCANENQNILMNSTIRSTLNRRNCEKCQEDLSISPKNTLKSTSIVNQVLNKCDRNSSVFLLENYRNNKKLGMTKTPNIIEHDHKAVLNHDLQNIRCFCNESNANYNLYNKNEIHCEQNVKFQQKSLPIISQQRSLEAKTRRKRNQSNITNETDCNISIQTKRENSCDINKSITTEKSRKGVYTKGKGQKIIKSIYHLQIKKNKQKRIYRTVHKYKQCNNVTKNKYYKVIGKGKDTSNFSTVTIIPSSKIDTKINKDIARHKNCIDIKNLIIPLIKIDDLSTFELSKLIQSTKCIENKENIQKDENICNETKNIAEIQCSEQEEEQEQEINILYKSVFEQRCTKCEENEVNKIDENIRNITFEKETYKISPENILQFFLKNKRDIDIRTRLRSSIENIHEYHIRKSVAMCSKCTEVFNLLRQFSGKVNFVQNEKVCIECTLCNLKINTLFHFQKHLMDVHLQCERKSLHKQKKFAVAIINFSDQLDLNINKQFIFECCCCSKTFDHTTNFEEHIKNMHHGFNHHQSDDVKKYEAGQMVLTSESYTTFKNEHVFNETRALGKNYIFDALTNIDEISNSGEEINIQNNHINEYDINTKIILTNNIYHTDSNDKNLLSEMEVKEKQMNDINNSDVTQIRKENQKFKEDIEKLNVDEKHSNSISELKLSNVSIKIDRRFKEYWKHKRSFSFICNVCFKKYRRKQAFLSHISKHITDFDTNVHEQQKAEENNDFIRHENDVVLNAHTETTQENSENFKDNNVVHSTINLAESDQNTLISKTMDNEVDSDENGNIEYDIKEDSVASKTDDYNFALYVNLTHTQKTRNGAKRQKLMKFNMNIAKKCKTNTNEQQSTENEIENVFPTYFTTNTNSIIDASKENVNYDLKELHCIICDKKFSSLTILKEHMFYLHDLLFEDPSSPNLSMIPYEVKNLSTQGTCVSKMKHNMTCKIKESKKILQKENKQKYRKWRCNACKENFALLRNYLRHKYYCHNDESVVHVCDNCNKILTSVAMVNIHICTNVTTWNCKRCSLTFSNGISLTRHNMNYHLEKVGPHVCKICKLNFLTMYMLTRHETTHSISNNSDITETFIDLSVPAKDYLPYTVDNINVNSEFSRKQLNDEAIPYRNENVEIKELDELNEKFSKMHITSNIPHNDKNILHCDTLCATAPQLHLEKREICRICNSLYFTDELIKHLISDHIVPNNMCFRENDANIEIIQENINSQNDIIEILGIQRLLSLYEYQRFDTIVENKCFSCITCPKEFSNTQQYKVHYLKYHDTICLLCNIKFEHNFQALEHKIKIHKSIDLYLWIAQKLILQLRQYGNTIEDVILKSSEIRV